jgi:phosphoglycolate phosphatase
LVSRGCASGAYDSEGWRKTVWQPGAREAIDHLRNSGCDLYLVTNKPAHATHAILRELSAASLFHEIVCRDSRTPPFASKAEMLANLLERRELLPSESIMVGDTLEDCGAAAEAGIECFLVPHGYGAPDGRLPGCCRVIKSWNELLERANQPMSRKWGTSDDRPEYF